MTSRDRTIDILMVTHNRPDYTRLSLKRLLETCDETMRVWVWHNGKDRDTLDVVESFSSHPSFYELHRSPENKKLHEPTNWFWANSRGGYLGKVDDDCLVPMAWAQTLRRAHEDVAGFGVLGCWRFLPEDYVPELAERKLQDFGGGYRILQNTWVEGSGYLMKRACVDTYGLLRRKITFPMYCKRLALNGWIHGWYFPFLYQEHLDDPRSPHCMLRTDEDLQRNAPLTAQKFGVYTLEERIAQIKASALRCQSASTEPLANVSLGPKLRQLLTRHRRWPRAPAQGTAHSSR